MGVRAVLFDVDGTLVDSVDLHARAWHEALRKFGKDVPYERVRSLIGKGGDQLVPDLLTPEEVERDGEALKAFRSDLFQRVYRPQARPLPGARELVLRARDAGLKVALASSGKADDVAWNRRLIGLDGVLDAETTSDDAERSKPHPDIFDAALAQTGAGPEEAIAIGDSPWDAEAARRAGVRTIGVLSGGFPEADLRGAGCFAIYYGPADLLRRWDASPLAATATS
jgi:HAD superfamily hydrolase (TIGR01509 family)